jgi:hypothetical protein
MRTFVWTGIVAVIVTVSGAIAGQQPSERLGRPATVGMITLMPDPPRMRIHVHPTAIVNRILSFDANGDDRIARNELPERMEGLVTRGDRNQDGFLTADEIVPLVDIQPTRPRPPFTVRGPESLADVIADLKLPSATHNRALAVLKAPRNVRDSLGVGVDSKIRELLDDEDYENYVAAATRLRKTARIVSGNVGGVFRDLVVSDPSPSTR